MKNIWRGVFKKPPCDQFKRHPVITQHIRWHCCKVTLMNQHKSQEKSHESKVKDRLIKKIITSRLSKSTNLK